MLVGWAAVQDSLSWTPIVLFVAMFLWTPPHFWALAVKYADDYRVADVPMLPSVAPIEDVVRQMIWYTVALVVTTLVLIPVADLGWIYGVTAAVLGAMFIGGTDPAAPQPDSRGQYAVVRILHHLCDRVVRLDDARRVRPVRLVTDPRSRSHSLRGFRAHG